MAWDLSVVSRLPVVILVVWMVEGCGVANIRGLLGFAHHFGLVCVLRGVAACFVGHRLAVYRGCSLPPSAWGSYAVDSLVVLWSN